MPRVLDVCHHSVLLLICFICELCSLPCTDCYAIKLFPPVTIQGVEMNQMTSDSDKKKSPISQKKKKKTEWCKSLKRSGAWGEVSRGWPLLAVMKERECITGSCVLYERDRKDSQSQKWHERGTVRVREKQVNHLKGLWGWHLRILCHSPFANIPRPQKTLSSSYLMLFCSFIIKAGGVERKIPLVYSGHTTTDRCLRGSTAEDLSSHSRNWFPVCLVG